MKYISLKSNFILLICIGLCVCCSKIHQRADKVTDFVKQHGEEDFSIFDGVYSMFYRGSQDSLYLLGGIIPGQQGDYESSAATNIYYNISDFAIVKLVRARDGCIDSTYTNVDSTYINNLARMFVDLDIYEIRMDPMGRIIIQIDEQPQSLVIRFDNDSIKKKWNKECNWEKISDNWYVPIF